MTKKKKSGKKGPRQPKSANQPPAKDKKSPPTHPTNTTQGNVVGNSPTTDQVPIPAPPAPRPNVSATHPSGTHSVLSAGLPPAKSNISRYVSFGLLLAVIALLSILFYEVMAQFLVPLFLAALLVVVFRPVHQRILEKTNGREKVAALLTTFTVLLAVLVPIGALLVMAAAEGRQVYSQFNATQIVEGIQQIRTNMNLDMPVKDDLRLIEDTLIELQENITLSPSEEDRHQIGLYEIEEAGQRIGLEQGLAWPDQDAAETSDATQPSDWILFALSLQEARQLHDVIPWRSDDDRSEARKRHAALLEYQAKLNEAATYFSQFRTQLLGGKARAWAIEMVNPSDLESEAYAARVVNYLRERLFRLSSAGFAYFGSLLLGTAIMIIGLYFFLLDGPKMIEAFKGLSPIDDDHEQELVAEFGRVSRAVVVATLLSALVQGLLAGIGFYFAGLDSVFLLTVLSAVLAMVPFVGAAAVWIPCCIYLYFFDNNLVAAIGLGVYGVAVISMADNVIKPFILHGQSNLHPLFALLSVLGGVSTLGPIGILIGPMVVAFLQTLLKILQREMSDLDNLSQETG